MCNYSGNEFNEKEPTSVCINGFLFDSNSYDGFSYQTPAPDEVQVRCPQCNTVKFRLR